MSVCELCVCPVVNYLLSPSKCWYKFMDRYTTYCTYTTATHMQTLPTHAHHIRQRFKFPLTSSSISPTFIAEVLPLLARLLFDGRPAVYHVDPPLHFHILLAFLQGLDEKLPIISPDQTWLEKKTVSYERTPSSFKGRLIPLEPVITVCPINWKI